MQHLFSVFSQTAAHFTSFGSSTQEIVEPPWQKLQKQNQRQPTLPLRQKRAPAGRGLLEGRVMRINYFHPLLSPVLSCAAHRGALLNPTDVDDPALSAVNPSVSKINYDIVSPGGAARAQANGILETTSFVTRRWVRAWILKMTVTMKMIGGMFMKMITVMEKSHYQSIVSLLCGARVLAVSLRLDDPQNQTQKGCLNGMLWPQ